MVNERLWTGPGLPEGVWFKLCGHGRLTQRGIVICLGFGRRDVSDWLERAPVVEPVHPFECGEFYRFIAAPSVALGSVPRENLFVVLLIGSVLLGS